MHEHFRAWCANRLLTNHQQVEVSTILFDSGYLDGTARIQVLQICAGACTAILEAKEYYDGQNRVFYEEVLESCHYELE
jgi:hypothetical protein